MEKPVSILDTPELIFPDKTKTTARRRKSMMLDYLRLMQDSLLAGNEWPLPGNFGSFRIEKKVQVRVPIHRIPQNGKLHKVSVLNRIGFSYQLVFIPGCGKSMKDYKFETADSFRKKLSHILMNTQKEYPFYDKR